MENNMKLKNLIYLLLHPIYMITSIFYRIFLYFRHDHPWLTPKSVIFLEELLNKEMIGFEWGSGRSTKWFGSRIKSLTSIEQNKTWHSIIQKRMKNLGLDNIECKHVDVTMDNIKNNKIEGINSAYVNAIDAFANDSLDVVVVDGHYRHACIQKAISKIKTGGYLLVDNTNWIPLDEWNVPVEWKIIHRSNNVVTETTIWQKV